MDELLTIITIMSIKEANSIKKEINFCKKKFAKYNKN